MYFKYMANIYSKYMANIYSKYNMYMANIYILNQWHLHSWLDPANVWCNTFDLLRL